MGKEPEPKRHENDQYDLRPGPLSAGNELSEKAEMDELVDGHRIRISNVQEKGSETGTRVEATSLPEHISSSSLSQPPQTASDHLSIAPQSVPPLHHRA